MRSRPSWTRSAGTVRTSPATRWAAGSGSSWPSGDARSVAAIGPAGFANWRERAFTVESLRATHRATQLIYGVAPQLIATPVGRKLGFSARTSYAPIG